MASRWPRPWTRPVPEIAPPPFEPGPGHGVSRRSPPPSSPIPRHHPAPPIETIPSHGPVPPSPPPGVAPEEGPTIIANPFQTTISALEAYYLKVGRPTINAAATPAEERSATVAADGSTIPIPYGRQQYGAEIYAVTQDSSGNWVVGMYWCMGEVEEIESLTSGGEAVDGVTWTHYTGTTTQGVDTTLAATITGYADTLVATIAGQQIGICHSVAVYPKEKGWLRFEAIIRGLKTIYDPRLSGGAGGTAYTTNAALCLADFLDSDLYGAGRSVDWDSVETAADANDEAMADDQPRRTINLALSRKRMCETWVDTLRAYSGCLVVTSGNTAKLVPLGAASVTRNLTAADVIQGSLSLSKRGVRNAPTVVRVKYTDTSTDPWTDAIAEAKAAGVDAGTTPRRETELDMPGIDNYQQACREAVEYLNDGTLTDLDATFDTFDESLKDEIGDVITLTHPIGLTSKKLRIRGVPAVGPGRWRLITSEYDPAAYSDEIPDTPSTPDTTLPSPLNPPTVTGLAITEEVYQLENGLYSSRLKITWDVAAYVYLRHYEVQVFDGADMIWQATTGDAVARTLAIKEAVYYTIKARTISSVGALSDWVTDNITPAGKYLIPGNVPGLRGLEVGGEVMLSWDPAVDIDIWRYEVRWGAEAVTWDNATLIDRVDALRLSTKEIPAGTVDFLVKALDSVGQYSTTEARKTIVVTLDTAAFLIDNNEFQNPALTNVVEFTLNREDAKRRFVTDMGDTIVSMFPNAMSTYTNPLATYHSSAASELLTETWDLGLPISGTWLADLDALVVLSGTVTANLELSENGSDWDQYSTLTAKATARYARVRIQAATTSTFFITIPGILVRANAVPREETGSDTSLASGGKTITMENEYAAVHSIILTPEGTTAKTAVVDAIVIGATTTFDVYVFNSSGTQIASDFLWTFRGV